MGLSALPDTQNSLADRAYGAIVDAILSRDIALGEALIMDQLAGSLGISRTPVRDALLRLEIEGVLETRGRRGYVVRVITGDDVRRLYQAREAVEGYAAGVVAAMRDSENIVAIGNAIVESEAAMDGTVGGSYRANRSIHRAIISRTGNRYLASNFDAIWGVSVAVIAYGHLYEPKAGDEDLVAGHADLLAAIATGNPDEATTEMVSHIREGLAVNLS